MSTVTSTPSKRSRKAAAGALAVALLFPLVSTTPASAADSPWMNTSLGADQRAALLLAEMTLAEKVDLMTGNQGQEPYGFFNAGIPRLGIPALRMQDAGAGISPRGWSLPGTGQHATAMPSGIALGATWDPEVVPGYATVVGNEAKNTGGNVLLGPNADLIRQPWWGRINETESEDPFLTAALVKPFITAVQDNDLMATIKHPIAYNQELFRSAGQNAVISERALAEVHNLPFKAASEANVASAMCSFNKINGVFSCENDFVLNELLRQQGGFPGFVMTDFGAMHSTIPALKAGTDMETGTANFYGAKLVQAVNNGEVDVALVNRSVIRILTPMFEFGLFDTDYTPSPINVQAGSTEALKVQNQAITLLKNGGSVLPLTSSTQSIAVIGADANIIASPGGAPYVSATQPVPALDGIRARADKAGVTMTYSPGNDPVNGTSLLERADMTAVPSTVLAPASGGGSG
ncbi:MAG: glycoside hydrolase family 3 N-terminal domain-containing protein, partial [Terrimesophilobacter sp.]